MHNKSEESNCDMLHVIFAITESNCIDIATQPLLTQTFTRGGQKVRKAINRLKSTSTIFFKKPYDSYN